MSPKKLKNNKPLTMEGFFIARYNLNPFLNSNIFINMRIRITESQYRLLVEISPIKNDYSPENIRKVASQYTSRTKFNRESNAFYKKALVLGMIDELFPEKMKTGEVRHDYSPENIRKVASQYTSRTKFSNGSSSFYNKALVLGMIDELFPEKMKTGEVRYDYSPENIRKVASQYQRRTDFASSKDSAFYKAARKLGMMDELFPDSKKMTPEDEDKKIELIINHVKGGGEFTFKGGRDPFYDFLYNKLEYDKTGKFEDALNQIRQIQSDLGIKREWWGERIIKDTLIALGFEDIPEQGQHKYKDCKNSLTCKFYKFDIYLPYNENNYMVGKNKGFYIPETGIIFEYDGIQHFKPIDYWGGEEGFRKRTNSDREKNSYCQNNNIKLVRIPYTSKTIIDIKNDIVSALENTDTFILTGDYPKLGWNQP